MSAQGKVLEAGGGGKLKDVRVKIIQSIEFF